VLVRQDDLCPLLEALEHALAEVRALDTALASRSQRAVEQRLCREPPVSLARVVRAVCEHYHVLPSRVRRGRGGGEREVRARAVAVYLAAHRSQLVHAEIGRWFGGLSPSWVRKARDRVAWLRQSDDDLAADLGALLEGLGARAHG
jgi:chromosomal replication initiation ATPase DnaA